MASDNKKVYVIIGIGAVVGAVGSIYLAGVVGERGERRVITTQVDEWVTLWRGARGCLVGDEPAASDGRHAALVRLATTTGASEKVRACDKAHLRKLVRPGEEQTGVPAVEEAWNDLATATAGLMRGFAGVLDTGSFSSEADRWARLGDAIAGVDAAYAALRKVSKLPPDPPPGGELTTLAGVPVGSGGAALVPSNVGVDGDLLIVESARDDGTTARAVVRGPDRIAVHTDRPNRLPAADDDAWGLWFARTPKDLLELRAGPLPADAAGESGGALVVATRNETEDISALFALGQGAERAVYFQRFAEAQPPALMVARSSDGGASFGKPVALASGITWHWPDRERGRFDAMWRTEEGAVMWVGATRAAPAPAPVKAFDAPLGLSTVERCAAPAATWWLDQSGRVFRSAGGATSPVGATEGARLVGCSDERAAVSGLGERGPQVWSCGAAGCAVALTLAGDHSLVATVHGGDVFGVSQIADVAVVWRGSVDDPDVGTGRAYALPSKDALHSLHAWNGKLFAALQSPAAVTLVELTGAAAQ